jgi:DNA-binding NarL/FixJ family response regulator
MRQEVIDGRPSRDIYRRVEPSGLVTLLSVQLVQNGTGLRVLVVDDVRVHRDNMVGQLSREPGITAVMGAVDGTDALRRLSEAPYEVILLSMAGADSLTTCRALAATRPVVALAIPAGDDGVVACAEAGVSGYLMRDDTHEELIRVITTAARGETSCPPAVAAALMRRMAPPRHDHPGTARLTPREQEILALIDEGMSNKEIARKLSIEVRTVKNHVHNLLEKLRVHRRGEAAALMRNRAPYGRVH